MQQLNLGRKEETVMINNYEVPEAVEIGRAQDVILGSSKLVNIFFDGPEQEPRQTDQADDE